MVLGGHAGDAPGDADAGLRLATRPTSTEHWADQRRAWIGFVFVHCYDYDRLHVAFPRYA